MFKMNQSSVPVSIYPITGCFIIVNIIVIPGTTPDQSTCKSPGIESCDGLINGDYQSCLGCNVYATCDSGRLIDNRPCPENTVWDDNKKMCSALSDTCPGRHQDAREVEELEELEERRVPGCIKRCQRGDKIRKNGDYASCKGCGYYSTCLDGRMFKDQLCAPGTVWDGKFKRCDHTSSTCNSYDSRNVKSERFWWIPGCITYCNDRSDGNYASCKGCQFYATCVANQLIDNRPCPSGTFWDNKKKLCDFKSSTCWPWQQKESVSDIAKNERNVKSERFWWIPGCIKHCNDRSDGNYASCKGCQFYATCVANQLIDNRPCPSGTFWDNKKKLCDFKSSTCWPWQQKQSSAKRQRSAWKCVSSCQGVANGDYQSCQGCHVYASCSNGILYDKRPCASNLVWDDKKKKCEYKSETCGGAGGGWDCIDDCNGVANGDYQSCAGCHYYATCSNEILYDKRKCPANLVWDDNKKRCEYESDTCQGDGNDGGDGNGGDGGTSDGNDGGDGGGGDGGDGGTSDGNDGGSSNLCDCIHTCVGMPNGDYQSCRSCHVFASCSNNIMHDNRPCPAGLVWDDNLKQCEWTSQTCNSKCEAGGDSGECDCITSCNGVTDGDYQSCQGCHYYASCGAGIFYDKRPCPADLVWDDKKKKCLYTSTTCGAECDGGNGGGSDGGGGNGGGGGNNGGSDGGGGNKPCSCVKSCEGVADGDYQSCYSCNYYVTCSNGLTYDKRKCPANLVWDDHVKRCEWTSSTCGAECGGGGNSNEGGDGGEEGSEEGEGGHSDDNTEGSNESGGKSSKSSGSKSSKSSGSKSSKSSGSKSSKSSGSKSSKSSGSGSSWIRRAGRAYPASKKNRY